MCRSKLVCAMTLLGLALAPAAARAGVTFSGSNGSLSASAYFQQSGNNLLITLSNTGTQDALVQADILTAVFFDLTATGLQLQSATASAIYKQNASGHGNSWTLGSLLNPSVPDLAALNSTNGGPGNFAGGWQYRESGSALGGSVVPQHHGLGTNGLGIFDGNVKVVDNEDYALTSAADNLTTSQSGQLYNVPFIKSTITFTLTLPTSFVLSGNNVSNVRFQFGTDAAKEPSITDPTGDDDGIVITGSPVPEPGSIVIFAGLLAGTIGLGRSRRRNVS